MNVLFTFSNVAFSYGQNSPALFESLDFEIAEGEFLAITGPSGSGKSTILSMMEGFLKPSIGKILFDGIDMASFSNKDLAQYRNESIGSIFQFFQLVPDMTALDNVALPAIIGGASVSDARKKAERLLQEVKLSERSKKKVRKLSGGEQQRVAIARAMINDPRAILADEPTGNLDKASTSNVMGILLELVSKRKIALVMVTHDMEIAELADTLIRL